MGFPQSSCTNSMESLPTHFSSKTPPLPAGDSSSGCYEDINIKSLIYRMVWSSGLARVILPRRRRSSGRGNENLEHNKAWLLAESGGCGGGGGGGGDLSNADPQSVHSSFRFSLCSKVELESMSSVNSCPSATVLMVNLDNGLTDPGLKELKWRRFESLERSISPVAHSLVRFSYSEIVSATRNFSQGRVLGRGALSYVFRGRIGFPWTVVAIKSLDKEDKETPKAFCRELMIASSLHNPYIVPLLGFCIEPEEGLFLVYKYVSGGNLERYLHGKKRGAKGGPTLSWSARHKVAVGIAKSIRYLHNGTGRCVVHRDIKPSNILLSSRMTPKLCDFGLATWTPAPSVPFLCKTVKGTFGYLAPEYFQHGKVSDKTDIYAFGIVLLELLTGRKPFEGSRGPGEENLVLWAKPLLQQGALEKLLDPRLKFPGTALHKIARMIRAAAACINSEESRRPNIGEIIAILRGINPEQSKKKGSLPGNSSMIDCCAQLKVQQTKTEMKSHLALAMLGVSEFEDEDFYCR